MPQRSSAAIVLSLLGHIVIVAGAALVGPLNSGLPPSTQASSSLHFVFAAAAPLDLPPEPLHLPRMIVEEAAPADEALPEATPPETRPALPEPVPTVPEPEAPVAPVPVERPVVAGLFPSSSMSADAPAPARQVQAVGFESAPARGSDLKVASAVVGAFETAASTQSGNDRRAGAVVGGLGFGGATPAPRPSAPPRTVAGTGFGASPAKSGSVRDRRQPESVQVTAFAEPLAAQAPKTVAQLSGEAPDTPVEILFKPAPLYTDAARSQKLEGDVVLEVEFCASSKVRVLRIVRGLGHGLDESAARAAEQIRFKPAQRGGRPIDLRTTVNIIFRLT